MIRTIIYICFIALCLNTDLLAGTIFLKAKLLKKTIIKGDFSGAFRVFDNKESLIAFVRQEIENEDSLDKYKSFLVVLSSNKVYPDCAFSMIFNSNIDLIIHKLNQFDFNEDNGSIFGSLYDFENELKVDENAVIFYDSSMTPQKTKLYFEYHEFRILKYKSLKFLLFKNGLLKAEQMGDNLSKEI